jgi:hypothetical protein
VKINKIFFFSNEACVQTKFLLTRFYYISEIIYMNYFVDEGVKPVTDDNSLFSHITSFCSKLKFQYKCILVFET